MEKPNDIATRFVSAFLELEEKKVFKNRTEASKILGVSPQVISEIMGFRMKPPYEILQILFKKYGLNPYYIFNGETPVYLNNLQLANRKNLLLNIGENVNLNVNPSVNLKGKKSKNQITNEPAEPYLKKKDVFPVLVTVDEAGTDNIVLVDVKAAAGYATDRVSPTYFRKLPAFKFPGLRNGTFRAFQIEGDSMLDTLEDGMWVIGLYLDRGWQDIREGYIHVIVTHTDVFIKRLLNRVPDREKIVMLSDNEGYPPKEIDVQDVTELWRVKMFMGSNMPNKRRDTIKLINNLQADLLDVKDRLLKIEGRKLKS